MHTRQELPLAKRSTSRFCLDGDRRGYGLLYKSLYYLNNLANNSFPRSGLSPELKITHLAMNWEKLWETSPRDASPARKLSDLFWASLPWDSISKDLGTVRILDIGCGAGGYAKRILRHLPSSATYQGIDVSDNAHWQLNRSDRVRLDRFGGTSLRECLTPDFNLIMSQSAFEHIEPDLAFFIELAEHARQRAAPTLQIHLLPSAHCLSLYGLHGYRQYTPRSLGPVCEIFGAGSSVKLIELGGKTCNAVHRKFISGKDRRKERIDEYDQELRAAFAADAGGTEDPTFYALVIQTHFAAPLL